MISCTRTSNNSPQQFYAPLIEGLGNHQYPITTLNPDSQRFFNQGLILVYGFQHSEATRSFGEAARLDSTCAMAYWGIALSLGPNINAVMSVENETKAREAVQKALALLPHASQKEQVLILALAHRYEKNEVLGRSGLDSLYAEAMRNAMQRYPEDADIATLCAEALMDLHPWDLWQEQGDPKPWTLEIAHILEHVLEQNPLHPGANHYYIHVMEASPHPEKALPSANRLRTLVPGASHLVHMPSHTYIRTGNYHEASLVNELAIKADSSYVTQCKSQNIFPMLYSGHNYHFLCASATLEGRKQKAFETALRLQATMHRFADSIMGWCASAGSPTFQHYASIKHYVMVKFGMWQEILQEPLPMLRYPRGMLHFARGLAYIRSSEFEHAEKELHELQTIIADTTWNIGKIWETNSPKTLLQIASAVLTGEIAATKRDFVRAEQYLQKAVEVENTLTYDEPSTWFISARHNLGAILLETGKAQQAQKVYEEDLRRYPENGWALFGLQQSLAMQGKMREAQKIHQRFQNAWSFADVRLSSSRF